MNREDTFERIYEYYKNNYEEFCHDLEELDYVNGILGNDKWYPMWMASDFFETLEDFFEALTGGYFNSDHDYFKLDCDGTIYTADNKDYDYYLDYYFLEELEKWNGRLILTEEVRELLDNIEE